MADAKERRRFSRFDFDARTELFQGEHCWPVQLVDVSLKGILVHHPHEWSLKASERLSAHIHLDNDQTIILDLTFSHKKGDYSGFRINHIDLDSITHLKQLCALNLGDDELLYRELESLIEPDA